MKNIIYLFGITFATVFFTNFSVNNEANSYPNSKKSKSSRVIFSAKLIAETYEVGDVTLSTEGRSNILITYKMKDGWVLDKTNLFFGDKNSIPKKSNGCPNLKSFNNKTIHSPSVTEYTYSLPTSSFNRATCYGLVTKAVVTKGSLCLNAWSEGKSFSCNNEAKYYEYCRDQNGGDSGNTQ